MENFILDHFIFFNRQCISLRSRLWYKSKNCCPNNCSAWDIYSNIHWDNFSNSLNPVFWAFYYTAAGLHALHVLAGVIIMAIISVDLKKGINTQRVELIGNYWHFVDIVWIFLFPLLYIAK